MQFQASDSPDIHITRFHEGVFRQKSSQSLWHFKSQFLRQVVTVINNVTFSDTINVFTQQQDRSQRKIQKFIGLIQQKARLFFLLFKSIIPSPMVLVNTERRWERWKASPQPSKQATSLFPSNSHTNFSLSKGTPSTKACPPQLNVSTFPHSHSLNLFAFYSVVCFITMRETPTLTSYIVYCLKNLSFFPPWINYTIWKWNLHPLYQRLIETCNFS